MTAVSERRTSTVLIVDDTVEVRYLVRMLLANVRLCQVVGEAANGEEALARAAELRPDIVILDVAMPVMNGIEALPRLKELLPESKIIVYSSYPEARDEVLRLGAYRYLEKGKDPHDVVEAVREAALSG